MAFFTYAQGSDEFNTPQMESTEAVRRILQILNESNVTPGSPTLVGGQDPSGSPKALQVTSDGSLKVNLIVEDIEIGAVELKNATTDDRAKVETDGDVNVRSDEIQTLLTAGNVIAASTDTNVGAKADAAAGTDTGTFSLISLFKRLLQGITTGNTNTGKIPSQGTALTAASIPVNVASDQTVPVSMASAPLPPGGATAARQDTGNTSLTSIDSKITAVNTGAVVVSSSALPSGASTGAKQDTGNTTLSSIDGKITAVNTGAVVVSSSALPSGASTAAIQTTQQTSLNSIDGKITAVNTGAVVVSSSALPSGAATAALQSAEAVLVGAVNETAPASDTASSGLNGRLQRIAQNLTTLIAGVAASSSGNDSITTNGTGSTYTALNSQACRRVIIVNDSGTDIEVRQGGAGVAITVYADTGMTFDGLTNASNLSARRVDQSNTTVTVKYRWEA